MLAVSQQGLLRNFISVELTPLPFPPQQRGLWGRGGVLEGLLSGEPGVCKGRAYLTSSSFQRQKRETQDGIIYKVWDFFFFSWEGDISCFPVESPETYSDCWPVLGDKRAKLRGDKRLLLGGLPLRSRESRIYIHLFPELGVKTAGEAGSCSLLETAQLRSKGNMYQKGVTGRGVPSGGQGKVHLNLQGLTCALGRFLGFKLSPVSAHTKSIVNELV